MEVRQDAPVREAAERVINAPRGVVWSVLTDLEGWPGWNPDVTRMEVDGPLEPGTVFRWTGGGSKIVSRLEEVVPERRIAWTGRTMGIRAVHVWTLEPEGEGVRVSTRESFEGPVASVLRWALRGMLAKSLASGLEALDAECRRRVERAA